MALTEAQTDLRRAHVNGGAGVLVSGAAWLAAGIAFLAAGPKPAFITLFVCGLAIAPMAQLVGRFVFKAPASGAGKRLEWIAIAVGLRYLAFPVMYGGLVFVLLGAVFIAGGAAGLAAPGSVAAPMTLALALTELTVGALLARQWRAGHAAA